MNRIDWASKALKQLRKLPNQQQRVIVEAARELAHMPNVNHIKSLKNHEYGYRLRVGRYRVFFDFDGGVRIVHIQEVKKRDERTY